MHHEHENPVCFSVKTRTSGKNDLKVSALGLGCMGMSEFYGSRFEKESLATIDRELLPGVTFLDTADVYGPHTNEELVGRAIKGCREMSIVNRSMETDGSPS